MLYPKYAAELLGTFVLAFVVWLSAALAMPLPTPVVAALTLGLFVYTVGGISGAHLNPAVTLGLLSVNRISTQDAAGYILAQFIGGILAQLLGRYLIGTAVQIPGESALPVAIVEALGAFLLVFAVLAVTMKKVPAALSGVVIGGSLLLGIYVAASLGNGLVNPVVAFAIGSLNLAYLLGPIFGGITGAWAYHLLSKD